MNTINTSNERATGGMVARNRAYYQMDYRYVNADVFTEKDIGCLDATSNVPNGHTVFFETVEGVNKTWQAGMR